MTTAGHGEDEHTQKMHRARPSPKQLASRHVPAARTSRPDQMLDLSGNVMHGGSHVWRSINRGTETDQQPTTIHQRPVSATMIDGIILPLLIGMAAACKGEKSRKSSNKRKRIGSCSPSSLPCVASIQGRRVIAVAVQGWAGRCCCFRLRPERLKSAPERLCVCVVWRGERGSVPGAGAELHPGDGWAVWGAEDRC